jgi:hypothetical protein
MPDSVTQLRSAGPVGSKRNLAIRPVNVEYERELREVSRLDGLPAEALPEQLRKPRRTSTSPRRSKRRR